MSNNIQSSQTLKTSKFSPDEDTYLKNNCAYSTASEMAQKLNRPTKTVESRCKKLGLVPASEVGDTLSLEHDIQKSPIWPEIAAKLTTGEVTNFLYLWNQLVQQFNNDITPLEFTQIQDVIMTEIQIGRLEKNQKNAIEEAAALKEEIAIQIEEMEGNADQEDRYRQRIGNLKKDLANANRAALEFGREAKEGRDKKIAILKAIKGTRDQRLSKIESKRKTYVDLIKYLIENPSEMRQLGIELEKNRLATDYKLVVLSDLHKYADNEVDRPFLSTETIKLNESTGEYE